MGDDRMDRRGFWRALLRGAVEPIEHTQQPPRAPLVTRRLLRPPGAVPEPDFLAACVPGCRICTDACPVFAVIPSYDAGQPGGGDGRPYLIPHRQACVLCGLCMLACPTGALVPTPPGDVRIGRAVVLFRDCLRAEGQSCHICSERCPVVPNAVHDEDPVPRITAEHCTGCGLCAEACPPHAIVVVPRA